MNKISHFLNRANHCFRTKGEKLPTVCIFGPRSLELSTPAGEEYEERRLDCRCYPTDAGLAKVLVRDKPQVLISFGKRSSYPKLAEAPFKVKKRWLHYDNRIHDRLSELGCEDFIWDEKRGCSDYSFPNPQIESHATLIAEV